MASYTESETHSVVTAPESAQEHSTDGHLLPAITHTPATPAGSAFLANLPGVPTVDAGGDRPEPRPLAAGGGAPLGVVRSNSSSRFHEHLNSSGSESEQDGEAEQSSKGAPVERKRSNPFVERIRAAVGSSGAGSAQALPKRASSPSRSREPTPVPGATSRGEGSDDSWERVEASGVRHTTAEAASMSTRDANALSPASPTSAPHLRFARTTSDPTVHRLNAEPAEEEREHEEERGRNGWLGDAGAAIGKRLSLRNGSKHQGSASEEVTRSTELAGASNTGAERGVPGEELEPERAGAAERVARHQAVEALSGGRSGRRRERESSEGGGSGARTPRRSTSLMGRKSMDANGDGMRSPRRSFSLIRRSMDAGPVDPLREPRRSIGKRPSEFELAARDPHHGVKDWWKHKRRAVPFAAPYANSGVVLDMPATLRDWIIPGPLTFGHGQWWYLVVAQSIVPALISGAINFGVAVALYLHQPSVTVWVFDRQTVAGDMGVTVIIQMIVQFVLVSALVHQDLAGGPIGPLRRPWPPLMHLPSTPSPEGNALGVKMPKDVLADGRPCPMGRAEDKGRWTRWWWWGVRAVLTGSERNDLLARGISWRQRLERFVWTAVQGFCLCALTFWWYWPIAIAIVAPIYEHDDMAHTYKPMIIKLLYGGIMALITNPIMALMAMGAESSVRRCYPELPIWHGERDAEISSAEQGMIERRDSEAVTRRNSMVTAANTPRGGGSAASSTHDLSSPTSPRMHGHTHEHSNGQGRPRAYTPIYEEPNAMPPTPAAVAANGEPSGPPVRSLPVPYVHGAPEPAHVDPSASAQA